MPIFDQGRSQPEAPLVGMFTEDQLRYIQNWLLQHPIEGAKVQAAYTTTNVTESRTFDADTVALPDLADVVGTLIADAQTAKIIT